MLIFLTHLFPFNKEWYGGGNEIVNNYAATLTNHGCEVVIFTTAKGDKELLKFGLNYIEKGVFHKNTSGMYLAICVCLRALKTKPDLIIAMNNEAIILGIFSKLTKIPVFMYQAAPEYPDFRNAFRQNIRKKLGLYYQYLGAKLVTGLLAISHYTKYELINRWGIPAGKIDVARPGISEIYLEARAKREVVQEPEKVVIVSVGRITLTQKPLDKVAEALAEINGSWDHWYIVGDGRDLLTMKALIDKLGIGEKVTFCGARKGDFIVKLIASCSISVLPSYYESFFLTAYESVLAGIPTVTNDVADIALNLGGHRNLLICDSVGIDSYVKAIKHVIDNLDRYRLTQTELLDQTIFEKYRWSKSTEVLFSTIKEKYGIEIF